MIRKYTKASLALVVLSGVTNMAHAAIDESSITPAEVQLVFAAPATVYHTLEAAETSFEAGVIADGLVLANGDITVNGGGDQLMAYRFDPSKGTQGATTSHRVIHGVTDAAHTLAISLLADTPVGAPDAEGWVATTTAGTEAKYDIQADGGQTVAADNYVVYTQAAIWSN